MHTMHEHPGRCRGCLVVVAIDVVLGSLTLSPRTAALASASRPDDACSCILVTLRFLKSLFSLRRFSSSLGVISSGAEHEHLL